MASFAETPQGKEFLSRIVRPATITSSATTTVVELPKEFTQYEVIEHGKDLKPECGDTIVIHDKATEKTYEYILGLNKFKPGMDAIINTMSLGEVRKVSLLSGDEYTITLKNIIPSKEKTLVRFSQNPVTAKLACGARVFINFNIKASDNSYIFRMDEYLKKQKDIKSLNIKELYAELNSKSMPIGILKTIIDGGLNNISHAIIKRSDMKRIIASNPFKLAKTVPNDEFYAIEYTVLGYEEGNLSPSHNVKSQPSSNN